MKYSILNIISTILFFVFVLTFTASAQTVEEYTAQARKYSQKEQHKKAIEVLKKSLQVEQHPFTYYFIGAEYFMLDEWVNAVEYEREAIKRGLNKDLLYNANNAIGVALIQLGQNEEAINALLEALRLQPENEVTTESLGNALYNLGRYDEAAVQFRNVLRINPKNAEAQLNLSNAEAKLRSNGEQKLEKENAVGDKTQANTKSSSPNNKETEQTSGTKPSGGLWRATISNGYKGQTLSFRVSADSKTISDITFQGYLICRGSRTENTQLAPLENVSVVSGSFSDTQLNGSAQVKFIFNGTFDSATTARGTYRVIATSECDTYELKWTATRNSQ